MAHLSFVSTLPKSTWISSLASVGIHTILALSLPALSAYSNLNKQKNLGNVQVVSLSAAEQSRIPQLAQPLSQLPSLPSLPSLPTPNEPLAGLPIPPLPSYPPPPAYPDSLPQIDINLPPLTIPKQPRFKPVAPVKTKPIATKVAKLPPPPKVSQKLIPPISSLDSSSYVAQIPPRAQFNQTKTRTRTQNRRLKAADPRQALSQLSTLPPPPPTDTINYPSDGGWINIEPKPSTQGANSTAPIDNSTNSPPLPNPQSDTTIAMARQRADFQRQEKVLADIRQIREGLQQDKTSTSTSDGNRNYLSWVARNQEQLQQDKAETNELLNKNNLKKESFVSGNYPKEACFKKIEGTATVHALVDAKGNVIGEPEITQSAGYKVLNTQAIKDVKDRTFNNSTGKRQAYQINVGFEYNKANCPALNIQEPLQG